MKRITNKKFEELLDILEDRKEKDPLIQAGLICKLFGYE